MFHAENSTTEIIQIIRKIQERHVPVTEELKDDTKTKTIIQPLLFGGDQLTGERIINAQKGFYDGRNDYEMLQGLKPIYEDWHLKGTLYEVSKLAFTVKIKYFKRINKISLTILEYRKNIYSHLIYFFRLKMQSFESLILVHNLEQLNGQ